MHEAFAAALSLWPRSGVPDNPRPWLISTARFKAIDSLRRRARFDASQDELVQYLEAQWSSTERSNEEDSVEDDRLRLIFTCCHPSLPPEAHVALTLREVCGLTTEEIAKAFLTTPRTLAQRIVRAKAKIRDTPIRYEVPSPQELARAPGRSASGHLSRLQRGLFGCGGSGGNAGRANRRGDSTGPLAERTPARARSHWAAFPDVATGIPSRRENIAGRRADLAGEPGSLALEPRVRSRREWHCVESALKSHSFGSYTLQAAIAAVHAEAESAAVTDWRQIVALYNRLARIQPSPVVELNRAVAIAMRDGPEVGLTHIDAVLAHGELANYHLAHSARADMCRRLGRTAEARSSYEKALALTQQEPERKFLQERLRQLK